jgi:uncharacterized membrane protein
MSTETPPPLGTPAPITEDRTVAILAYLTIIGFIIAIVIHSGKKTALGSFHLRQVLGLIVSAIVFWVGAIALAFIPFIGWIAILAGWLCLLIIWITGLVAAASGQQKPALILGVQYQKWFAGAFT